MPIVGCPAKGTSAMEVNMSMVRSVLAESEGRCKKTISERLNSVAMACFWACVRADFKEAGTCTTARGFPA